MLQLTASALTIDRARRRDPISGGRHHFNQPPLGIAFPGRIEEDAHTLPRQNVRDKDSQRSLMGQTLATMYELLNLDKHGDL
jgi:hypothetical protein